MKPITFKMSLELVAALKKKAITTSVVRGKHIFWSQLVREILEQAVSEPEPTIIVQQ